MILTAASTTQTNTYVIAADITTAAADLNLAQAVKTYDINQRKALTTKEACLYNTCEQLYNSNKPITFSSSKSAIEVLEYAYTGNYDTFGTANNVEWTRIRGTYKQGVDEMSITALSDKLNREHKYKTIKIVIDNFPIETGTTEEILEKTAENLNSRIDYDSDATYWSIQKAIKTGRGICVHYAKIGCILLNLEGIPAKVVSGNTYGKATGKCLGGHSWIEAIINGKTTIVEFTQDYGWKADPNIIYKKDVKLTFERNFLGQLTITTAE